MNIKTLRKDYKQLTLLERLSLADNAKSRNDESELKAIIAASPRENHSQVDFYSMLQQINTFRFCNLITRLSYVMQFDYFLNVELGDHQENFDHARLSAFLYVRTTDAWAAICAELGLQSDFNKEISEHLFSVVVMERKGALMREFAFTEAEVATFVKQREGSEKIQTLNDEKQAIRAALGI